MISALSAIAQAESESTGEAIKWGLKRGFISGNSKLYSRKCFGYQQGENGDLIIDEEQAQVVRLIYDLYLNGSSIVSIIRELESQGIKSPQGKDTWSKRSIQTILTNEKYAGHVLVGKTYSGDFPNNKQRQNRGEQEQFLMKKFTTVSKQKCSAGAILKWSTAKQNEKIRITVQSRRNRINYLLAIDDIKMNLSSL